ncbi:hypothetical protein INT47_008517 [Mucor saturninus]|uniref:RING-type E3 ubiquitin transferase BRCA1 n=1 Tax=Mucor saturninus TaxID=64648 RepID=A0A8H7R9S5_9FUNG|nr:hypothetical protein INT47_008517 [Mucor saturninus]
MKPTNAENTNVVYSLLAGMSRELRCSICLNNFSDATSTPCGHTFCKACIEEHLSQKQFCPLCNHEIDAEDLNPSFSVQAIVEEFKKMREEFEKEHDLNLSQVPIQYLSHQDTVEQDTPRNTSASPADSEGSLPEIQTEEARPIRVYVKDKSLESTIPDMTFVDEISENTTHLVLDLANPSFRGIVNISDQYLLGILHGCYIVDSSWLEKCLEMNAIYPETRFEIAGEVTFGRTGAPAKSRKNRLEGKNQKLFRGFRAKLATDDEMSKKYEKYIRIGGGTIVGHGEVIVCDEEMDSVDADDLHDQFPGEKLLFKGWIDECICTYELVNKDKYVL